MKCLDRLKADLRGPNAGLIEMCALLPGMHCPKALPLLIVTGLTIEA